MGYRPVSLSFSRDPHDTESPDGIMGPSTTADCLTPPDDHVGEIRLRRAVTVDDGVGYFAAQGERDRKRREGCIA